MTDLNTWTFSTLSLSNHWLYFWFSCFIILLGHHPSLDPVHLLAFLCRIRLHAWSVYKLQNDSAALFITCHKTNCWRITFCFNQSDSSGIYLFIYSLYLATNFYFLKLPGSKKIVVLQFHCIFTSISYANIIVMYMYLFVGWYWTVFVGVL